MAMRHLICFGNELHGDDGFGPSVCRRLLASALPTDVRVFEAGTRGLDALALFEGCEEAILVDAMAPDGQPGRIRFPAPDECGAECGLAGHGGGIGYLLRALSALGTPPGLRIVAVEASALTPFRPGLSPAVAAAVDEVLLLLNDWLAPEAAHD